MDIWEAVRGELIQTIDDAYGRISHCMAQIQEEHLWVRGNDHVNSIGIIIQHLCGNLRQWIISGVGSAPDTRNRPAEFQEGERPCKEELMDRLAGIIQECKEIIQHLPPEQLLEPRRIQGFEETVLSALFSAIPHLELHGGQIVYITRLLLKGQYELRWKPQTPEEGTE